MNERGGACVSPTERRPRRSSFEGRSARERSEQSTVSASAAAAAAAAAAVTSPPESEEPRALVLATAEPGVGCI